MKSILAVDDDRATRRLLSRVLRSSGFSVSTARDGVEALARLRTKEFDLILLDVWMPRMNGLELLSRIRREAVRAKAVVMTSDNTPETVLRAVREQAYQYLTKPVEPKALLSLVRDALAAAPEALPIEVVSARPEWVELLVPCSLPAAERIEAFMAHLEAGLPDEVRESVGRVFHEMLANAVEWGGKLDPNRKVRIACLRARRMVLYRIADPGAGFRFADLEHAAVGHAPGRPTAHLAARARKGLRPGGFGILMARSIADELIYNEASNEVVFVKYLD